MRCNTYGELAGKRLLHHIINANGVMLFPEGWVLKEADVEKLRQFRIDLYDIMVEEVSAAEETAEQHTPSPATDEENTRAIMQQTESRLQQIESVILSSGRVPVQEVEQFVPTLTRTAQNRNIYKLFNELKASQDWRYKHTIGLTMMSTLLGRWLELAEDELSMLSLAASLCDIGMVKLPSSLLQKTTRLDVNEMEIMKQHTTLGYELLQESDVDPRVALVALQHHEREDGSGYPSGLKGSEVDRLSKVVALADVYVEMTSDRPERPGLPFYEAINQLHDQILGNRFDSSIGMTFLNRMMTSQIGSDVILSDGRSGKIVLINANYPARPLVAVGEEVIDLSKTDEIQITEIVG